MIYFISIFFIILFNISNITKVKSLNICENIDLNKEFKPFNNFQSKNYSIKDDQFTEILSRKNINIIPINIFGVIYVNDLECKIKLFEHKILKNNTIIKFYTDGERINFLSFINSKERESYTKSIKQETKEIKNFNLKANTKIIFNIEFDYGHCCDRADTIKYTITNNNKLSNQDIDNIVPQNKFYNRNIRNHLVKHIRKMDGSYKEIALYDSTTYKISSNHKIKKNIKTLEIPEAFVFISYDKNYNASDSYFFPNFIDYQNIKEYIIELEKNYKLETILNIFKYNKLIQYYSPIYIDLKNNNLKDIDKKIKNLKYLHIKVFYNIINHFSKVVHNLYHNQKDCDLLEKFNLIFPYKAIKLLIKSIIERCIDSSVMLDLNTTDNLQNAISYYFNKNIYNILNNKISFRYILDEIKKIEEINNITREISFTNNYNNVIFFKKLLSIICYLSCNKEKSKYQNIILQKINDKDDLELLNKKKQYLNYFNHKQKDIDHKKYIDYEIIYMDIMLHLKYTDKNQSLSLEDDMAKYLYNFYEDKLTLKGNLDFQFIILMLKIIIHKTIKHFQIFSKLHQLIKNHIGKIKLNDINSMITRFNKDNITKEDKINFFNILIYINNIKKYHKIDKNYKIKRKIEEIKNTINQLENFILDEYNNNWIFYEYNENN